MSERRIRNSAKAIIIKDGKLLVTKIKDGDDVFYIMPGGGQEVGETLETACEREVMEEFGIEVKAQSLEFVIEGVTGENFHRVDLVFLCEFIKQHNNVKLKGDYNQVGREWVDVHNLINEPLYPSRLRRQILNLYRNIETITYLGDESMDT